MSLLGDEVAVMRRRARQDGQAPHTLKMHPMTWRAFCEEHRDLMLSENSALQSPSYMGLAIETDPIIPEGRVVVFDADGDLLALDASGKYRKVLERFLTEPNGGE